MSGTGFIPEEVRRFVLMAIPSVPYLEAMLLLREGAGQSWCVADVARRLYVGEAVAEQLLAELCEAHVAVMHKQALGPCLYRYQPHTAELERLIDRLAACYSRNLVGITELIHSRLERKAQFFADAFLWRKDK